MEENKLQPEEEAIRKMLANTFYKEGIELDIEDEILKEVYISKDKLSEIAALKRKARICLSIAAAFLVIYGMTCTNLFFALTPDQMQSEASIMAFNSSVVVGILLIFTQAIYLSNPSDNILKK